MVQKLLVCALVLLMPLLATLPVFAASDCQQTLGLMMPRSPGPAPDFTLPDMTGQKYSLKDFRGKLVFLNFWATWCPACIEEMPSIEELYKKFSKDGLEVIGLDLDVRRKPVEKFLKEYKITFRILLDPKNKVSRRYGIFGLPATFIIDREGKLYALAHGARQWDSDCSFELFSQLLKAGES